METTNQNIKHGESTQKTPRYVIYRNPKEFNRYFRECERRRIPFLVVSRKGDISRIEFDLITSDSLLSIFGYNELLALRDSLFERKLTRDVITSRGNGLLKVKRSAEQETLEKLWVIVSNPENQSNRASLRNKPILSSLTPKELRSKYV